MISLDIEGYSETDYFTPAVVTVTEGTSDYTAIVSKEVTEFCVYPHASHVMANVAVNAEVYRR